MFSDFLVPIFINMKKQKNIEPKELIGEVLATFGTPKNALNNGLRYLGSKNKML